MNSAACRPTTATGQAIGSTFTRISLLAVLGLTLALGGCGKGKPDAEAAKSATSGKPAAEAEAKPGEKAGKDKAEAAVPVEVAQAARRDIAASYSGTAALAAPDETDVVAKTSGILLKLNTEEGQSVKAGDVLAQLDPERTRLEVQKAEAALNKLKADLARSKELFDRKLIAADAYEKLRYDVETQKAAYDLARLELSYTRIVAPIDGVISQRMVKVGNLIQLNQPLFHIVNTQNLEAVLNVPERELATMHGDLPVRMSVDAIPGSAFEGHVLRVSPVVDAGSGTFRVTCGFDARQVLRAGMFGRIEVIYDQRSDVLTVPRTALLEGEGEAAVFAVREDKAVRVPVQVGYVDGEVAEIRKGLADGDTVVTTGKVALRDGSHVQVLNPPSAGGDGTGNTAVVSAGGVQ